MKKIYFLVISALLTLSFTTKQISWVALGDSITYLNDHPEQTYYRVQKGYMTRTVEALPELSYINHGYNGWTSLRVAQRIEDLGIQSADLYTVFLGTNDWWHGDSLGTYADYELNTGPETINGAFRVILDKLKSLNPDARIVLITPMQRGDFVYIARTTNNAYGSYKAKNGRTLEEVANAIKYIGEQNGLEVLDLYHQKALNVGNAVKFKYLKNPETGEYQNYGYPAYTEIPYNPDTDQYPYPLAAIGVTYDGLHPSDKGNEIISKLLVKMLK